MLRLGSLAALADFVFDALVIDEGLIGGLDVRAVYEDVVTAVIGLDESKALLSVEKLDGTCCHNNLLCPTLEARACSN